MKRAHTIILRRTNKKLSCFIELFGSGKRLLWVAPYLKGEIFFEKTSAGLRAWKLKVQKPEKFSVRDFTDLLPRVRRIIIPDGQEPSFVSDLRQMLNDYQVQIIETPRFCRLCLIQGRFTELHGAHHYVSSGDIICERCAQDELEYELRIAGAHIVKPVMYRLKQLLKQVRDVGKIVMMFQNGFDPTKNPEATIFDVKNAKTNSLKQVSVNELEIPKEFSRRLKAIGISYLTPIQVKAIQAGLLNDTGLLVVSPTTSGKTLIGELAGVKNIFQGRKMVYLSPLVALSNQKYEEFKDKYSAIGLRAAIKVGMSKIDVGDESLVVVDTEIKGAQLISATYEAFDYLLRSGPNRELEDVGTIIVDEIQMIGDEERGAEIDGLITRINAAFPKAQIIALSATIGNPEVLASELKLKCVTCTDRPIPLERHLVLAKSESDKIRLLKRIVREEHQNVSRHGYHGQSIIFTNSRKNVAFLAKELKQSGIPAAAYHGGLTFNKRKKVELGFARGDYHAVVTTAALGAGVDFPASQVVFMTLSMGNKWLTNAEFEQFQGRAGRLGKHDRGRIILLVQPGLRQFFRETKTEDEAAIELLSGKIENVEPRFDVDQISEQVLAGMCACPYQNAKQIYNQLIGVSVDFQSVVSHLKKNNMVVSKEGKIRPSKLGKATTISFLSPEQGYKVSRTLGKQDILDIAINIEPFSNAYLSDKIFNELERVFRGKCTSRLFSGSILDILSRNYAKKRRLEKWVLNLFAKWYMTFFKCECQENPFCDCALTNFSRKLLGQRFLGLYPSEISQLFEKEYEVYVYPGDVFNWLDTLVHHLRAVKRIAETLGFKVLANHAEKYIGQIERPSRAKISPHRKSFKQKTKRIKRKAKHSFKGVLAKDH
ncbi:MAG: DUF5814 domain-containing protein [Candidatus Ranarchaeia archaeon]